MSLDLGHSKSYIQSISSGRALPSMSEFLQICDYLNITPRDFFNQDMDEPILQKQLYHLTSKLSAEDLNAIIIIIAERLGKDGISAH